MAADSPAIDSGDPAFVVAAGRERDLLGNVRLTDGNLDRIARMDRGAFESANVRLDISGDFRRGGFLDIATSGTPGLETFLIVGATPAALELLPLGYLLIDPGTVCLCVPWQAAPSLLHVDLSPTFPRTTLIFQEFVRKGTAGNLSNDVSVEIR